MSAVRWLEQQWRWIRFTGAALALYWKLKIRLWNYRTATDMELRELAYIAFGDEGSQDDFDEVIGWWREEMEPDEE